MRPFAILARATVLDGALPTFCVASSCALLGFSASLLFSRLGLRPIALKVSAELHETHKPRDKPIEARFAGG